jgi:RNA polymerase sigma-70 factor (ECF subfamily)
VKDSSNHSDSEPAADPARGTSITLLTQAKAGDARAWQRLEFLYTPLVRWWCRRHGVSRPQDVEDVTQEVFTVVAAKIGGFTKGAVGSFRSWLYTITRHKAGDHYRRTHARPAAAGGSAAQARLEELPAAAPDSSGAEENLSERAILVRRALELVRPEFHPRTWEAAWRVTVEGQGPAEVGAALGMTAGAVHIAKSRVLGRLRELLSDLLAERPDDSASTADPDAGP